MKSQVILGIALGAAQAKAHFSFYHKPSQIACDLETTTQDPTNWMSHPLLEGLPFREWWFHGQVDCQDKAETPFELPAGGTVDIAMSGKITKIPRSAGGTGSRWYPRDPDNVYSAKEWVVDKTGNSLGGNQNIHADTREDPSGCALAIAYKSDAKQVQPEDFVVFSVVHDCPKRQREPFAIPHLPACPNGKCICAWFWIPKNSGLKNFYMSGFECTVTGEVGDAPVDVEQAIPPRRCLSPNNCNFGPRQPMYWLGAGDEINMPEGLRQSPHFSIRYGFREGAQHDIFTTTNPRRLGLPNGREGLPAAEVKCKEEDGDFSSRMVLDSTRKVFLKSPNCRCQASWGGPGSNVIIRDNSRRNREGTKGEGVWSDTRFDRLGPIAIRNDPRFKAGFRYFPTSRGPFRLDLTNECYLTLTDSNGMVLWESPFNTGSANKRIVETFAGYDSDPVEWDLYSPSGSPENASSEEDVSEEDLSKQEEVQLLRELITELNNFLERSEADKFSNLAVLLADFRRRSVEQLALTL